MVTIKDIARECGVSAVTVSAVINNKAGEVSAATRERVLEVSRRLAYRPSAVARRMVGKQMNTIGMADRAAAPSYWSSEYEMPILEGIMFSARRHRWEIMYFAGHPTEDLSESLGVYLDGRCDGMIFFSHRLCRAEAEQITGTGLPIILIGDNDCGPLVPVIDVDNVAAASEATRHLIDLGHVRIAMLEGNECAGNDLRVRGYEEALIDAGMRVDRSLIFPCPAWQHGARDFALEILERPVAERPTAFFCFNDGIALGVLDAARSLGISVPGDISIVGFDDLAPAALSKPPLTTIRQPLRHVGERAIDILIGLIRGDLPAGYRETVPHELIVRGSTGPHRP